MQQSRTYTALALAGTLPFIAGALLPLLGYHSLPHLGPLDRMVASYGLAIACFVAGSHWGIYLSGRAAGSLNLFITSNVIVLAVWFAYVGGSVQAAVGVQVAAFVALLLIDRRLRGEDIITPAYLRLRTVASLVVVSSLAVIFAQ